MKELKNNLRDIEDIDNGLQIEKIKTRGDKVHERRYIKSLAVEFYHVRQTPVREIVVICLRSRQPSMPANPSFAIATKRR